MNAVVRYILFSGTPQTTSHSFSDVFYKQRERILYQMVAEWYGWKETNIFFYINCLLNITFRFFFSRSLLLGIYAINV